MTTDERLEVMDGKIGEVLTFQAVQTERWGHVVQLLAICNTTLHGNGRDGLVREVEQLKTVRKIRGRGFWALVALASSVISGTILALGGTAVAYWKGW